MPETFSNTNFKCFFSRGTSRKKIPEKMPYTCLNKTGTKAVLHARLFQKLQPFFQACTDPTFISPSPPDFGSSGRKSLFLSTRKMALDMPDKWPGEYKDTSHENSSSVEPVSEKAAYAFCQACLKAYRYGGLKLGLIPGPNGPVAVLQFCQTRVQLSRLFLFSFFFLGTIEAEGRKYVKPNLSSQSVPRTFHPALE